MPDQSTAHDPVPSMGRPSLGRSLSDRARAIVDTTTCSSTRAPFSAMNPGMPNLFFLFAGIVTLFSDLTGHATYRAVTSGIYQAVNHGVEFVGLLLVPPIVS